MTLLLGFLVGLALVAPIGPVALTLFGLGAEQGRRAALAGAGGVVLADLLTMPVALGGAGVVQSLHPTFLRGIEVAMGVALVLLALVTVVRSDRVRSAVAGIRRPLPTMATMTIVNPLGLVAWTGVALAIPASLREPSSLVAFGVGLVLASAAWHGGLAIGAGTFAPRLSDARRTTITRCSGGLLLVVGSFLVA